MATTVGVVAGPNLVVPLGRFATAVDLPPLSGPFLLAAAAYLAAGAVLFALLRPDPFLVARQLDARVAAAPGRTRRTGPSRRSGRASWSVRR